MVTVALACPSLHADRLDRLAVGQQEAGVGVPQVVQPDHRRRGITQRLGAPRQVAHGRSGENRSGCRWRPFKVTEHQGVIAGQHQGQRADEPYRPHGVPSCQRLTRESRFERGTEQREALKARPQLGGISPETREAADEVAKRMGLTKPGPTPANPPAGAHARYELWAAQHPYSAPLRNPESTRDRAARHRQPIQLAQVADNLNGAVGGFTAA